MFKDAEVISRYGVEQAIEDGALAKVFENRWKELSGGKPIVATASITAAFSLAALREIWNEFVIWRVNVMPTLKEEDQMFTTTMNSKTVWVLEDNAVFTVLFPEDY
jgi:dTDP-4-amino-4,6-dideoxygalactose transaminase